jgi:hypothetical protein
MNLSRAVELTQDMDRCIASRRCRVLECRRGSHIRCFSFWIFRFCTCGVFGS